MKLAKLLALTPLCHQAPYTPLNSIVSPRLLNTILGDRCYFWIQGKISGYHVTTYKKTHISRGFQILGMIYCFRRKNEGKTNANFQL